MATMIRFRNILISIIFASICWAFPTEDWHHTLIVLVHGTDMTNSRVGTEHTVWDVHKFKSS